MSEWMMDQTACPVRQFGTHGRDLTVALPSNLLWVAQ